MNDHNQTLFFSKTRKYLYHDTNIYIKWEDLCTSILYELNLNILHSTFHGRNKEFFSTFTTNNAVTTNKMCGEYLRNSHFAVLRNSYFAVSTLYPQNNVLILVLNICHHCPTWHT
jgi:hypothetical protein